MIVYGSRMYGRRNLVKGWSRCDNCGKYCRNSSYNGRKWGHIYFIPLIPEGPRSRVVRECKKCQHGFHIAETDVPDVLNDIKEDTKAALAALLEGRKEFERNGTKAPASATLSSSVTNLICLQADDHLRLLMAALQEKEINSVYHLMNGEVLEFQGKLDEALEEYRKAVECDPTDWLAMMTLGSVYLVKKDNESARLVYEQALAAADDKLPVHQVLLSIYTDLKDHAKIADTYEHCFELMPELKSDKKAVKTYKKSCKKAARQPVL